MSRAYRWMTAAVLVGFVLAVVAGRIKVARLSWWRRALIWLALKK